MWFQLLSAELRATEVQSAVSTTDIIYRQNVAQGRDKYKTLKQIRQGNTKHRVDIFEAMWLERIQFDTATIIEYSSSYARCCWDKISRYIEAAALTLIFIGS